MFRELKVPTFTFESNPVQISNQLKHIKIMRKVVALIAFFGLFFLVSCDKTSFTEDFQLTKSTTGGNNGGFGISPDPGATRDTVSTAAYFDERLIRVLLSSLSQNEISYVIGKHVAVGYIYTYSDPHMPAQFVPVVADVDINPIWREETITFNPGFDPHQFLSYAELDAAIHAGEVTLVESENFYRYQVTGK